MLQVGSNSPQGAGSAFIEQVLLRICDSREYSDATISPPGDATTTLARSMPKSFLASVDMAHAVHPNYAFVFPPLHLQYFHLTCSISTSLAVFPPHLQYFHIFTCSISTSLAVFPHLHLQYFHIFTCSISTSSLAVFPPLHLQYFHLTCSISTSLAVFPPLHS